MAQINATCMLLILILFPLPGFSADNYAYNFGEKLSESDIRAIDATVMSNGQGLPAGSGSYIAGKGLYLKKCVACHGGKLDGVKGVGNALIGGRNSLSSKKPKKTVESYWPKAPILFDYLKRAMPFDKPGSLTNSEVYALSAYILGESNIIDTETVLDAKSLVGVNMPNKDGFFVLPSSGKTRTPY